MKSCEAVEADEEIGFIFVVLIDSSKKPSPVLEPVVSKEVEENEKKRAAEEITANKEELAKKEEEQK